MAPPVSKKRTSVPFVKNVTDGPQLRFEIDAKNRPWKAEMLIQAGLNPNDVTYAVLEGNCLTRPILSHGAKHFTNWEFSIARTRHENWDSDDEDQSSCSSDGEEDKPEEPKPLTKLTLPLGMHCGEHKGQKIWFLVQEVGDPQGTQREVTSRRDYILFAEGRGKVEFIKDCVESLLPKESRFARKSHFMLYRWSHCQQYWEHKYESKARPMDSVVLPDGIKESVEADMERFLGEKTKKWYKAKGIPYKRCYMFYGTPGTGKTSLITALAGRFRRKVCFLSAHHPRFTDEALKTAMEELPHKSFVVLEDIDSLFDKDRKSNNGNIPLTFTGLLNVLDGIGEQCGTIFIMTTNFIDRLDSALIRAGRVDMKVEFKKADDNQLVWLFKWFYDHSPEDAEKMAPKFVEAVRTQFPDGTTMAELQQHFVDNMNNDCATCVATLKDYDLPLIKKKEMEAQRAEEARLLKEEEDKKKDSDEDDSKDSDKKDSGDSKKHSDEEEEEDAPDSDCSRVALDNEEPRSRGWCSIS